MAKVTTDNSNYTAIAQAIREKNGGTETYKPSEMAAAIGAISTGSGGTDTSDATATADQILEGKTAYVNGEKLTGTIAYYPNDNSSSISWICDTADNFSTITFQEKKYLHTEAKVSNPTALLSGATVGTLGLLSALGNASASDVTAGKTFTSYAGLKVTGKKVDLDTSDATAAAEDILSGKTAYVNGEKVTGSISSKAAASYTPGTADQTISSGQYLSGAQTIKGDSNLVAGNIKSGVSIFGVTGQLEAGTSTTYSGEWEETKTYTKGNVVSYSGAFYVFVSDTGVSGAWPGVDEEWELFAQDTDLVAGNVKSGVSIFGVTGTYEGGSGANNCEAYHITSTAGTISFQGSGTVKVWGYGYYSSGTYTKTTYAFVGDGYYTASSYGTPSKTSATFSISNGTLSGLPSNISDLDVLVTIGN